MNDSIHFSKNESDLIKNLLKYYNKSKNISKDFGGPLVYFHLEAIKENRKNFLSIKHIEMIYATLASWGLHRMGKTKTKLVDFSKFKDSILSQKNKFKKLKRLKMVSCDYNEYVAYFKEINKIYNNLKVSESNTTIVSHSKTLAHILPDLIPPVDRQYTIRFFDFDKTDFLIRDKNYRQIYLPMDKKRQFAMFKYYACKIKCLFDECYKKNKKLFILNEKTLNTSYPKIIDNLIVAYVRSQNKYCNINQKKSAYN